MPDCGDNSCMYAEKRGGMRTNSGCRCDECPECGRHIRAGRPHQGWCPRPEWVPEHQRRLHETGARAARTCGRCFAQIDAPGPCPVCEDAPFGRR